MYQLGETEGKDVKVAEEKKKILCLHNFRYNGKTKLFKTSGKLCGPQAKTMASRCMDALCNAIKMKSKRNEMKIRL